MASSKKNTSVEDKKGNQPKATARHAKMTQTKKDEIENLKNRISTDKYLAKKYESNRKTEIKALPKEDRAAAKEELKESIAKRKEAEKKDKERLRELMHEDKKENKPEKDSFDEDTWVQGGKKKAKKEEVSATDASAKPDDQSAKTESLPEPASKEEAESPKKKK